METINANAASLCNYEVMQILQQLKDDTQKKHKREGSLATVTYETLRYLQDTECKSQNTKSIEKLLTALMPFKLTKIEKLMILNTPPKTPLEIQLSLFHNIVAHNDKRLLFDEIVQESEERLTEAEVNEIIQIVNEILPAS